METSCDDTAIALMENGVVRAHSVYQQDHNAYGGVVPHMAAHAHLEVLPRLVQDLLTQAECSIPAIDTIAVTRGPGLVGGLLVGCLFAKGLALRLQKPLWPVHHLHAHALMPRYEHTVEFPYLVLLMSGGHCLMATVHAPQEYTLLGQTYDDAAGECFDKVARALGGPYPGGPYVEHMAQEGDPHTVRLPIPLLHEKSFSFSFSGLKTAAIQWIQKNPEISLQQKKDFCASFQHTIAVTCAQRLVYALEHTKLTRCVISGGVAANRYIMQYLHQVAATQGCMLYSPSPAHCTDNGIMVAWAAHEYMCAGYAAPEMHTWQVKAHWPL